MQPNDNAAYVTFLIREIDAFPYLERLHPLAKTTPQLLHSPISATRPRLWRLLR